jgi:hypothetical protein
MRKKPTQVSDTPLAPFVPYKEVRETPGELAANMKWLEANWKTYENLWVALSNGALVASGEKQADLTSIINSHSNRGNVMCLKIGENYLSSESQT